MDGGESETVVVEDSTVEVTRKDMPTPAARVEGTTDPGDCARTKPDSNGYMRAGRTAPCTAVKGDEMRPNAPGA